MTLLAKETVTGVRVQVTFHMPRDLCPCSHQLSINNSKKHRASLWNYVFDSACKTAAALFPSLQHVAVHLVLLLEC